MALYKCKMYSIMIRLTYYFLVQLFVPEIYHLLFFLIYLVFCVSCCFSSCLQNCNFFFYYKCIRKLEFDFFFLWKTFWRTIFSPVWTGCFLGLVRCCHSPPSFSDPNFFLVCVCLLVEYNLQNFCNLYFIDSWVIEI